MLANCGTMYQIGRILLYFWALIPFRMKMKRLSVHILLALMLAATLSCEKKPQPVTPDKPIRGSYLTALNLARDYFYIQNPYFCPPASMIQALIDAKERGVDVRIMIPRHSDIFFMEWANSSHFRKLMKAGIRIYLREDPFMHCKAFVADDYLSCIGSCNLDSRSLQLNFEDNL